MSVHNVPVLYLVSMPLKLVLPTSLPAIYLFSIIRVVLVVSPISPPLPSLQLRSALRTATPNHISVLASSVLALNYIIEEILSGNLDDVVSDEGKR